VSSRRTGTPKAAGTPRAAAARRTGWRRFVDYPRTGYRGLHRWLPSWRVVLGTFLGVCFLGLGALVAAYATIQPPLPGADIRSQTTTVYYADNPDGSKGAVMGTLFAQKRQIVDYDTLPDFVGKAVAAGEDRTFFTNSGVSLTGMARAFLNNVSGGATQGGSTLTQQYVERYYVDRTTTDYVGKAREVLLALKISRTETKEEILGRYLNTIYFGRDSYGIQAAAQAYFGVDAKDLNVSQAALLAGIIPSPNNWDPAESPQKAEQRWNTVLDAMVEEGWLDPTERAGLQFPETIAYQRSDTYAGPQGYLLKMVEDELGRDPMALSPDQIRRGGYTITTTVQQPVQAEAERTANDFRSGAFTNGQPPLDATKLAISTVDPSSGAIVALYGGPDYITDSINRATYDVVQAGSTFKPFTLVAALEQGIGLRTTFNGRSPQTPEGWGSTPVQNFGNEQFGTIDLTDATAKSVNTVYAQLNLQVGPDKTAEVATRAGITTPTTAVPSNVLGVDAVHPLDMADAYATFAAQGVHHSPYIVATVQNHDGSIAYQHQDDGEQVFAPEVMADTTYAMTQVVQRGSGADWVKPLGRPIAGKTGTSQDNKSAWFVGFTPDITTAVTLSQVGDDGKSPVSITPVGQQNQVTGGGWPARMWASYMEAVLAMPAYATVKDFPPRAGIGDAPVADSAPSSEPTQEETATQEAPAPPEQVAVPDNLQGKLEADASAALVAAGLTPAITTAQAPTAAEVGRVMSVSPGPGTMVDTGSPVTLVIGTSPPAEEPEVEEPPADEPSDEPSSSPDAEQPPADAPADSDAAGADLGLPLPGRGAGRPTP